MITLEQGNRQRAEANGGYIGLVKIGECVENGLARKEAEAGKEKYDKKKREDAFNRLQKKGITEGKEVILKIGDEERTGVLGEYNKYNGRFSIKGIPNQPGISGIRLLKLLEPPSD